MSNASASRLGLPRWVWGLALLLIGCAVMLALSRETRPIFPSLRNQGPSGVSALGRLLVRAGYEVRETRDPVPRFRTDELTVAFALGRSEDDGSAFWGALERHERRGGRTLLVFADDFAPDANARHTRMRIVRTPSTRRPLEVTTGVPRPILPQTDAPAIPLWSGEDETAVARLVARGDGARLDVASFTPFSNLFLDESDNAEFALDVVGTIAGRRKRIVLVGAAYGNAYAQGLAQAIGPWFAAALTQIVVLFLTVAYSLGKGFGRIREEARPEPGSRELLDGLSEILRRGRKAEVAWKMVAAYGMSLARRRARLGLDAPDEAVLKRLPESWQRPLSYRNARDLTPERATALARELTDAIAESGRL